MAAHINDAGLPSFRVDHARRAACALFQSSGASLGALASGFTREAIWPDILALASPSVLPYLDDRLDAAGVAALVPPPMREALRNAHQAATIAYLARRTVLKAVLSRLEYEGIETILLKGVATAETVYPRPHLRPMADIDIWVTPARLPEAARCLLQNGFAAQHGGLPDGELSPELSQRRLVSRSANIRVELHGLPHSLEGLSKDRIELCWKRSVRLTHLGPETRTLGPEDALLHTCLHLGKTNRFAHCQLPLLDASLLIETYAPQLDWGAMRRDWVDHGVSAYLTVALRVARTVWGARVPDDCLDRIWATAGLGEMESLALEQMWQRRPELPPALERVFREPTRRSRVRAVAGRVLTNRWRHSEGETMSRWHVVRWGTARLKNDVTVKVSRYLQAWLRGDLTASELRRRSRLAAARGRIGSLADDAEPQLRNAHQGS